MTGSYPTVYVRTREIADPGDLLALIPADLAAQDVMSWVRRGEGMVAWGRAAHTLTFGESRFEDAEMWFNAVRQRAVVDDDVQAPASGLVAFGSFSFRNTSTDGATLVIPAVLVGRKNGRCWVTTCSTKPFETIALETHSTTNLVPKYQPVSTHGGSLTLPQWRDAVTSALTLIDDGRIDKVVLARDEFLCAQEDLDPRWSLTRLADAYEDTWTFAVDGLIGATPEMLVRTEQGDVASRVLAGTIRRTGDEDGTKDSALAANLARSEKDLHEHAFAVHSVEAALAPHCAELSVPTTPFVLELPNVMHLATDVHGKLAGDSTSLTLAASLHPSAAVCGTPTDEAALVIDELEHMDRGRYAGPVGWMDAQGDGEWGIALRCGHIDAQNPSRIRLFAGCGIVAGSDPESEVAETVAKLAPMRHALGQ